MAAAMRRVVGQVRCWSTSAAGRHATTVLVVAAVALVWGSFYHMAHEEKRQTEEAARQNLRNLTRGFEEHIVRSLRAVDQTLLYVRDTYERDPDHFDIGLWSRDSQFVSDFAFQVSVVDKAGLLIVSNLDPTGSRVDLSDREHIKIQMRSRRDEMFISKPVMGRVSKKWSINVTRRMSTRDGSFGGVAVVSLDPDYLTRFYDRIDVGRQGVVTLAGTDGVIRARASRNHAAIGVSIADSALFQNVSRTPEGFYEAPGVIDGVSRLTSYRKVKDLPLVVSVGLAYEELFESYDIHRRNYLIAATVLGLLMFGVAYVVQTYQRGLRLARDDAEAASRARSEFLAMMSHEIRTPMNGVIGLTGLLIDSGLSRDQQRLAMTLRESGEHLLQIINEVLDLSKLDADRFELENIEFDLYQLLDGTVQMFAPEAHAKGVAIAVVITPDVPRCVIGDPSRLRQILFNLIGNAVKFTPTGGVVVEVAADRGMDAGHAGVTFAVRDSGIGIPSEAKGKLFQKFSQIDSSVSRRFGGTGLGLAICKALIDQMRGTITVESDGEKGSTFRVGVAFALRSGGPAPSTVHLAGCRILVIEKNPVGREAIVRQLELLGANIVAVDDHARASAVLATHGPFHCVVVGDRESGDAFARTAREHAAGTRLLLLDGAAATRVPGNNAVAYDAVLAKPVGCETLCAHILGLAPPLGGDKKQVTPLPFAGRPAIRILLAEDNPTNQLVAVKMLGAIGLRADVVGNGLEAVEAAHRVPYDLILMDVRMPELDGIGATKRIRLREAPADRVYIIALTANAQSEDRDACLAAGMNDFLGKPFSRAGLQDVLERFFDRTAPASVKRVPDATVVAKTFERSSFDNLIEELGRDDVMEILSIFLATNFRRLDAIMKGIREGRRDDVLCEAHAMKSAAAILGFSHLSNLARNLELEVGTIAADELLKRLAELSVAFHAVEEIARRDLMVSA